MKKIVIFSYSEFSAKFHKQILESIFGNQLEIDYWLASDHTKERIHADLAVLVSASLYGYARQYLEHDIPVIMATYTLEREIVQKIRDISMTAKLSLVSYTRYNLLKSRKALLVDVGIEKSQLEICDNLSSNNSLQKNVIYFGNEEPVELNGHNVIRIRSRLLSVGTVLEIGLALDIDIAKSLKSIHNYYQRVSPFHCANDYETIAYDSPINMSYSECEAIVMFNTTLNIYYCNENAEQLLKISFSEYMDKNISQIFPFLKGYSDSAIEHFGEQVVNFQGQLRVFRIEMSKLHNTAIGVIYISNYWEMQKRHDKLERQMNSKTHKAKYTFLQLIGNSDKLIKCKTIAKQMADSDENILIQGQSGVGKEIFAQAIHNASSRKKYPFVAVNCGAMVDTLMESEFFGYEEGAFTGAKKRGHQGYFEATNHGTLFLDEIGELPMHLQTRLLRVLQEHEIIRVGGNEVVPVDVRIVAATNKDLKQMIKNNTFRADLYYRICVLPLYIPSLSERREDIPLLVDYFKQKKKYNFSISNNAIVHIKAYDYEGNIRELENCLSFLSTLKKPMIDIEDLPEYMQDHDSIDNTAPDVYHAERYLINSALEKGKNMAMYDLSMFDMKKQILTAVKAINKTGIGAGRRSIKEFMLQYGFTACESEIRRIMKLLHEEELIIINSGRGGSKITQKGKTYLTL